MFCGFHLSWEYRTSPVITWAVLERQPMEELVPKLG